MENFFKMRRNGGELNRAQETNEENNFSTNQGRTMSQYGMADGGMNYGTPSPPLNKNHDDDKKKNPLVVDTPSGPKAPRGPQNSTVGDVNVSFQTKGRSTRNTDLLQEGKKIYKKVKDYFSS